MELNNILLGVIATAIVGLIAKILYDWLKHGRTSLPIHTTCIECNKLNTKLSELEACVIQEKMARRTIEAEITEHERRLDRGSEAMSKLMSDISDIKSSIATLLERSKRKREDYDP